MNRIEVTILNSLFYDVEYNRKVLPFLKDEYFHDETERTLFCKVRDFFIKYNNLPTKNAIAIDLDNDNSLSENLFDNSNKLLDIVASSHEQIDGEWLLENTEKFCKEKAVYNGIMDSIAIIDGNDKKRDTGAIPEIMTTALSVGFDNHIGHDFLENAMDRFDFYHKKESRLPFDLEYFNKITNGGLPNKTLNVFLAGTGVGKTLIMCHMAAKNLEAGRNVLYITMEMAEEEIAKRIDANLLDIAMDDLTDTYKDAYESKIQKIKSKTNGKLIIQEYPTASAGVGQFRYLLNELKLKKNFIPDIIYIDYINLCLSIRLRGDAMINSYAYIKAVAEEFRGLAVERNVPIVSATQTNRSGLVNSDPGLEDTSESIGLPFTVDFMAAVISNEELENLGQLMIKQLKNRYKDVVQNRRFVIGVDKPKMRLYDVEQTAQSPETNDDGPVMDNTEYGQRAKEEEQMKWATKKMGRKDFGDFKV